MVLASLGGAGSWPVDTPGGRFFAEWDSQAPVTREGQLIFFFQFLEVGQRWQEATGWHQKHPPEFLA
jgi:hypothetical protein